jgi:hypothetical protein
MIARTNLSHPKQTSLKLKIVAFQADNYYESPISTSDKNIQHLFPEAEIDADTLNHRFAERERIRQTLLAASLLVTDIEIPELSEDLDTSDNLLPIQLSPNSKTIAEWLEEERGEY